MDCVHFRPARLPWGAEPAFLENQLCRDQVRRLAGQGSYAVTQAAALLHLPEAIWQRNLIASRSALTSSLQPAHAQALCGLARDPPFALL